MASWDLLSALLVVALVSFLAYRVGRLIQSGAKKSGSLLFAESMAFSLLFAWFFAGKLGWARAIPGSGVVYWANLMPILLCFTAGLATSAPAVLRGRRQWVGAVLVLMAATHLLLPLIRPLVAPAEISARGQWKDQICLQTHASTCAPAAAATLLKHRGIESDERQMAQYCLTSRHGTEPLGLYRGLRLASERSGCQAKVASRDPGQWIAKAQLPNVALIQFAGRERPPASGRILGPRAEGHAIVVLGFEAGQWILGDPAVGQIRWSDRDFRRRFTGDAIYLAQR